MKSTVVFTSTLSANLMNWLGVYSKKINKTKRAVLEQALRLYQDKVRRDELKESFKRAAKDPEMAKMAEEGLDDYADQLRALDI